MFLFFLVFYRMLLLEWNQWTELNWTGINVGNQFINHYAAILAALRVLPVRLFVCPSVCSVRLCISTTAEAHKIRDVKALRPVWPRGQIIRPRPRPRCIWPQPHRSWPRGLEICSLYGLVNNLIFSSPYSQSNHQRSFLLCIGYLLKTTNLQIFFLLLSGHPVIFSLDVL